MVVRKSVERCCGIIAKALDFIFKHSRECNQNLLFFRTNSWEIGFVVDQLAKMAAAAVQKINATTITMIWSKDSPELLKSHFRKPKLLKFLTVNGERGNATF